MRMLVTTICLLVLTAALEARGQSSGSSQLGEALSLQSTSGGPTSMEDVGTLRGTERYLRRNRRPTDFIGPDGRESRRYVGALQARARHRGAHHPGADPAGGPVGVAQSAARPHTARRGLPSAAGDQF